MKRFFLIAILIMILAGAGTFFFRYYFVFGQGVKAGDLNFIVYKGYVWKTWEGRLIQTGFKTPAPGTIQSNEFEFSITNDSIAHLLELNSGNFVELRYKEYLHDLPWRGKSRYIVTEIIRIEEQSTGH